MKKMAIKGLVALAAVVALCMFFSGTIKTISTAKVKLVTAKQGKLEEEIKLSGNLTFTQTEEVKLALASDQSVTIKRVRVAKGRKVAAGDVLFEAEVSGYDKEMESLRSDYETAQKELMELERKNGDVRLKRTEEIEELENAIADLEDILKRPARINKIIMKELADVAKKYGKPRRCEIMYEVPAVEGDEPEQQIPDYPVHLFFTRDGYFKKITPQSLRMSGEQKLKDGDEVLFTCESTNSVELLFFTNHRQVYKSHAYDFNDSKASVLGDYVASALGMEEGEVPLYMVVTPDYKGWMLFFYDNGKCAKVPLSSYETKQNRRKLLKAYSDKAELAFMRHLPEETELAIFTTNNRLLLVGSALIPEKTTRDTAGVSVVTLKKNAKIARVTLAEGLELNDAPRYRVRTLPAAGAILKDDDRAEQLTL